MRRLDIGSRVLIAALVPAVIIAVALAWYFTTTRIVDLENNLRDRGVLLVRQLASASELGLSSGNDAILRQAVDSVAAETGVEAVSVIDARGAERIRNGQSDALKYLRPIRLATLTIVPFEPNSMIFLATIAVAPIAGDPREAGSGGTRAPLGHVAVQISHAAVSRRKFELVTNAALITIAGLLVAGLLARELTRGATRPLRRLAAVVSDIERGNLNARAATESSGLVKDLETGINDMASALQDGHANLERRIADATAQLQDEKDRAEAATRTKTQFLAAASHDLRQPLQALGLFVSSLKLRARDPDIQTLAGRIERAHGALEGVLDTLLDISRLDSGVVAPRLESFPLDQLFANMRDTFAGAAAGKRLRFMVRPTTLWVRSDPALLERVVSNLVSNALRYTEQGGVVLGARRIQSNRLRIEVWDSGIGIPADMRDAIFREFVQLREDKRGARSEGLGLGLAIVERLGRLLDHPITLRSRVGSGTVFSVTVPRAEPAARAADVVDPGFADAPLDLSGLRVLLIDDDADSLEALDDFFTQQGAQAIAHNGVSGARQAIGEAGFRPDVIISDYRLGTPETGISAIRILRAALGEEVPAIVITGETAPMILQAIAANLLPVLSKPVRPDQLRKLIHSIRRVPPRAAA